MMKVAVLSYWHVHANDYTNEALKHPDTEVAAVWDELPERGRQQADKLNVPFFESLDALLAQPEIEGVIIVTPTDLHPEVMIKCAKAGKHIFTEKVVAITAADCTRIYDTIAEHGVTLTVSLPRLNAGYTVAIRELLAQNEIGTLSQVRVRLSHDGAIANWLPDHFYSLQQCGGGALIDLGCHPAYLTRVFLGLPDRIYAAYGNLTGREVEDHAVAIYQYDTGAIGVVEAGFVNNGLPFIIEVHGSKGSILYDDTNKLRVVSGGQTRQVELPDSLPGAFEQWVQHIQAGTVNEENIALAADLSLLMEAANESYRQGRPISLSEISQ